MDFQDVEDASFLLNRVEIQAAIKPVILAVQEQVLGVKYGPIAQSVNAADS